MRGLRLQLKAKAAICLAMLFSLAAGVALAGDSTEKLAGPAWIVDGGEAGERFGYELATGDVNGDGYADVIAGAPYYTGDQDEEGRLAVICGSEHGLASAPTWIESGAAWARFGWSVAAGDVNGDGFDDVIVGAPYYTGDRSQAGRVSVYFGSAQGLHAAPAWSIEGGEAHALFGYAVAAADVDGDGRTDLIAGAPYCTQGQHEEGCAYAFLSSEAGLATTPAWHAEGNQADAHLGFALAGVG
ncbi:MAG: FG-GAP-like repeat-containing protein, partial [Gammaproteobacteria bacterium]